MDRRVRRLRWTALLGTAVALPLWYAFLRKVQGADAGDAMESVGFAALVVGLILFLALERERRALSSRFGERDTSAFVIAMASLSAVLAFVLPLVGLRRAGMLGAGLVLLAASAIRLARTSNRAVQQGGEPKPPEAKA